MENVSSQYDRVKGAEWFSTLYKKPVLLLGAGGIGSWAALFLARLGVDLTVYDHDLYESHNMTGQLVRQRDIGKQKSITSQEILRELSPDATVLAEDKYTEDSFTNDIVICGFDNMEARKLAFRKWRDYLLTLSMEQRAKCFFQDGRLNAELLQIFSISGEDEIAIMNYEANHLFNDDEVQELECTFKQTSHFAAMIAAHMVEFLTNWATNAFGDTPYRVVPFFHEHIGALNMTKNERSIIQ